MITPRFDPSPHRSAFDAVLQGVAAGLADLIPVCGARSTDGEATTPLPTQQQQAEAGETSKAIPAGASKRA